MCTHCGYHLQQGVRFEGHKTPGVDISSGTLALEKAASDMVREKELQKRLLEGAGMPPWLLGLILTILVGLAVIGVLAINFARRAETEGKPNDFNASEIFCLFGGVCCAIVGGFIYIKLIIQAFKTDRTAGLLSACVPIVYPAVFAWQHRDRDGNLKTFLTAMVILGIAGGFFYGATQVR